MPAGTDDDRQLQLFTILHIKKQSVHYRILRSYKDTLHGPSDRIRTCGILLPNLSGKLFPLVYSGFRRFLICFTYSLTLLSPLLPGVPAPSVVIYVVKNASRPVSGELSPGPDGKRFVFQIVCIVTLRRVLCKWFSGRIAAQRLSRYRQRNTRMPYSLKIKLASPQ